MFRSVVFKARRGFFALVAALILPDGTGIAQGARLPRWSLSSSPTLIIGDEADPAKTFSFLAAAVRLSTGEIAVVDRGSYGLRLFDAAGRFIGTFGRQGSGPGEFQSVRWIGRSQDSLFLHDWRQARISLYHARTLAPFAKVEARNTQELLDVAGRMRDGSWLVATMRAVDLAHPQGVYRDTVRVGVLGAHGLSDVTWLGTFPGQSLFAFNPFRAPRAIVVAGFPFGPNTWYVAAGTRVWIGDAAHPRLLAFDAKGTVQARIALGGGPRPPDRGILTRMRDEQLATTDSQMRPMRRALYDEAARMRDTPYFTRLVPGVSGEVWVEEHCPDKPGPCGYTAVSAEGIPVAEVATPAGVRLHDVGWDYVVGVHADPDGVESVRVYRLARR